MKTLSIAQAKNELPAMVHEVEAGEDIGITRYGQPVAVVMSHDRYQALAPSSLGFQPALHSFLERSAESDECLREGEADSWRDRGMPRDGYVFE